MKSVMKVLLSLILNLSLFIKPGEVIAKIFDRCELARVLHYQHYITVDHVAVWVCIAQHQSGFNTSALLHHADGGYHGMYQISDVYWCSPWGTGKQCNIDCARLRDENLYDDFVCMSQIYNEHQKISGDGYNAWTVYKQYCNYGKSEQYVSDCFGSNDLVPQSNTIGNYEAYQSVNYYARTEAYSNAVVHTEIGYKKKTGKVYDRCELARELLYRHQMPMEQIANWVCIAYHESNFNTSAIGRKNTDGSGDHGIFQISDIYWCSPPGKGRACGLSCAQLEDDDISDDVTCMKKIYDEHTRISGDGFTAWSVYQPYCLGQSSSFTDGCFTEGDQNEIYKNYVATSAVTQSFYTETKTYKKVKPTGKVYNRCELAHELKFVHNFPDDQIATWVCIAQHESNFNVSAIGRLNADGSGDHGLFQISDIYWCSPPGKGWACGLTCSELEDNDLSDDVACVKQIYEEHTRISGDGFNAWTVYPRYCKDRAYKYIDGCFEDGVLNTYKPTTYSPVTKPFTKPAKPGKVYDRCELARELKYVYNVPDDQIATWVCLAQHESSYNTSAVGIGTHGLFQVSDEYWCSPPGKGVACGLTCAELEDGDISNDLECVRKIHEEHTRISGDGFNAWAVYSRYCKERAFKYIDNCFENGVLNTYKPPASTTYFSKPVVKPGKVYERCELARELKYVYNIPDVQIATWVCIAQHESSYNTSAVGIGTHGLFQISDEYWCSPPGKGWACGLTCAELEDGDISNDLECVRKIYDEHTRLSGDGFNAWAVYPRYCKDRAYKYVDHCFDDSPLKTQKPTTFVSATKPVSKYKKPGKIYDRCDLARELKYVHNVPDDQLATWVCIAQHESNFNTSAIGRLNADGSGDHGLFQISDIYWCSPPGKGWACGLTCSELEDGDLTDDLECVRRIYEEHTRISGDGFNAWTVYPRYCKDRVYKYLDGCFENDIYSTYKPTSNYVTRPNIRVRKPGKIYDRCELARELKYVYKFPDEQISTWVCIVEHESSYNTSAVGRLNADGSGDHGLFQLSDIYWCSESGTGNACGLTCAALEDDNIADDVECVRRIHEEHTRLSGDGFNAWTVYPRYCKDRPQKYADGCFADGELQTYVPTTNAPVTKPIAKIRKPGKIYDRCELAHELKYVHNFPDDQIATWVCIVQHESNFNTSVVGHHNGDGSGDHGLFQISDIYWCSPPNKGWACGLTCSELEDGDITDDVECVRKIYEEHRKISGDGFNAWTVYPRYCDNGRSAPYIDGCFDANTINTYSTSSFFVSTNAAVSTQTQITKIYDRCELARDLKYVYNLPDDQLAIWVCIAQHESNFNTSAVGRLNSDGSGDHGLFQISDIYWCSPPGKGYACGLTCAQLEDNDIRDDIECARKIYEEHNRISGDGFNAWTVYGLYCKGQADQYIADCFAGSTYQTQQQSYFTSSYQNQQVTSTSAVQQNYPVNTFYSSTDNNLIPTTPSTFSTQYSSFNQYNTQTTSTVQNTQQTSTLAKTTLQNNVFFNDFFQSITQKPTTKAPLTTYTNQYFTVPQTYQPISQYTTKPGFYNYYTQQASTKNIVTTKPEDVLPATTPKPITIKKSTASSPKTKSTSIKTTTKPIVLPTTTPRSTLSTTTRKSTTKFTFPPFTTRSTTPNPFLTHHFFTIPSRKPIFTTPKAGRTPSTTKTTTPRTTSTTKTTTVKPRTTTRSSIFDRFTTTTLKPTSNPFKYFTTPRPTLKTTSTPFRFPFPVTNKKSTTKSIFNSFTSSTTKSPRTTRITTTTPRTTTRFDFDAFFSRKPLTTPSPRTIRATVPLITSARITSRSTTKATTPRSVSSRSTPRPLTSTLRSPFEITTPKTPSRITSPTRPPLPPYTTSKPITTTTTTTTTKTKTTSSITLSRSTFGNKNNLNITKKPKIETTTIAVATPSPKTTTASPFDLWFNRLKHR